MQNIANIERNNREYLEQSLYKQFEGSDVYLYHDNRGDKDCYIVDAPNGVTFSDELFTFIKSKLGGAYSSVATIDGDSVVTCADGDIIMFRDTAAKHIREMLYQDTSERHYKLIFKTAEYHSYIQLINTNTGKDYVFSAGGKSPVLWHSEAYLRDDRLFDTKYYRGDVFHDPRHIIPDFDCGSISTAFEITDKQAATLQVFLSNHSEYLKYADAVYYDLFFNNCSYFAQLLYNVVLHGEFGDSFHNFNYHIADELNFRDKGVFYNFLLSQSFSGIVANLDAGVDIFNKFLLGQGTPELASHEYFTNDLMRSLLDSYGNTDAHLAAYRGDVDGACAGIDHRNAFGETPLHIAIRYDNFATAIAMIERGADVNITDNNNQLPIYTALLRGSDNPLFSQLIKLLADKTDMINTPSYSGYFIPVAIAVREDDVKSVDMLITAGADANFTDKQGDNLLHIAKLNGASRVEQYLQERYPYLALQPNLDGDLPERVIEGRGMIARYVFKELDDLLDEDFGVDEATFAEIEKMYDIYPDVDTLITDCIFII
ncbi:MAG: ankyrin repeat domain-containing protein [Proteobacteria bacterium]|nr:ankyrin repeat domain-containing protein [Pseudomonadota bacterium]